MKIVVIDDEINCRILLKNKILKYNPLANIVGEADGVATGLALLKSANPDLVFLDIQMNDGTGFDLLNKVDVVSFKIIFTTAFDQYAIKAFKYSAVDYLLKPIDSKTLNESLDRLSNDPLSDNGLKGFIATYENGSFDTICLKTEEGVFEVELEDIESIKAEGSYCVFNLTKNRKILISKPLKEYAELLPIPTFIRVHKSFLINLNLVAIFNVKSSDVVLHSGEIIPVSRRNKMSVMNCLSKLETVKILKNN